MRFYVVSVALLLASCSSTPRLESCEELVAGIIEDTKEDDVKILKIYNPKTVSETPREISCKGEAIDNSSSKRYAFYFRTYFDEEDTPFVYYQPEPFQTSVMEGE